MLGGLTVMVCPQAVSKVPNAASSTKTIKAMDLKGVLTDSSSTGGIHDLEFSNLDATVYQQVRPGAGLFVSAHFIEW
jgi:hypothetical protein